MPTKYARKAWQRWMVLGCIVSSLTISFVAAQQPPQKAAPPIRVMGGGQVILNGKVLVNGLPDSTKDTSTQRVKLPVDPRARRKIEEANRFVETQDWQSAVKILQSLLDASEDNFLQESEGDKGRRVSVRAEANRMLGSLPAEGKRFYEQQFGSIAKLALKQAKAQANPQSLADVALKYVHTQAGAEAAAWLGAYHLDHGRYIVAALCFERLLSREQSGADLPVATLYKAALAFERAGDANNRERVWKLIQAKLNQPTEKLPVAIRSWDEGRLRNALKTNTSSRLAGSQNDWRLFMGSPDRAARSNTTSPFMEPMFPAIATSEPGQARNEIEQVSKKLFSLGIPIIPGAHPLIVRDYAIYRTNEGISAINLKTGAKAWDSTSDVSLSGSLRTQNSPDPDAQNYLSNYRESAPSIIVENTLLGTLSADSELVYGIEDLALPPSVQLNSVPWGRRFNGINPQLGKRQGDFDLCNHLVAYDIEGGRAVWSIGTKLPDQPFSSMFFLGPPLPLGDKLYVLAEVNAEIKLLCLQNLKTQKPNVADDFEYSVELVWAQPLGVVDRRITEDPVRRTQAATLSYSDGILVCPTNAGAVIGVDLLTRTLVWAYSYQNDVVSTDVNEANWNPGRIRGRIAMGVEAPTRGAQWSYAAPVISQGKVLLAPSDGNALHAVNLRDGTLAWSINRIDTSKDPLPPDYYLAGVYDDLVLLVGKQNVHAVELQSGKPIWNVATGIPVGRGIANEDTYFLPVKGNEVVGISLKTGQITSRSKARHKEQLGNLALIGEHLISLNHNHFLVYPIQAVKERQVAERLKVNARDAGALIDRGELRWQRGEMDAAIQDFRLALQTKPAAELRSKGEAKLADSLISLLETSFDKHENLLPELESITVPVIASNPDERIALQERKARFYRILAKGREAQGRMEETLASYQAFALLDDKIIVSPDDPQVRVLPRVWALAQAQAMSRRLKPEQYAKLEAIVQKEWNRVQAEKNLDTLKSFIEFYGELTTTGQKAQLAYAEMLRDKQEYSQATLKLLPLIDAGDATVAAQAHDAMARLNIRMGEMENAAYYYRQLAKRYPKVIVRDGKSGLQLYLDLMTDKRFLPYLDERQGLSNLQSYTIDKFASSSNTRYSNNNQRSYVASFEPQEELPPHLRRFSLQVGIDYNSNFRTSYTVRDQIEKKEILSKSNFALPLNMYGVQSQEKLWPFYQYCGNVMVFAWSNRVVGIDPVKKQEVWSLNVMGEGTAASDSPMGILQTSPVQGMPGRFQMMHLNGTSEILGSYGPGSANRLVLTIRHEGLVCIDPQTGEKLWTRYGITPGVEMFGDDEYAILLPPTLGKSQEDKVLAVRLLDGETTTIKQDIADKYRNALAVQGRMLLLKSGGADDKIDVTLLDPVTNTVRWQKSLDSKTTFVKPAKPYDAIGLLDRAGVFSIVAVSTGESLLESRLNGSNNGFTDAHFIFDDKECFLILCQGQEQKRENGDRVQLMGMFQWLRSIPVNGPVACIDRDTGKVLWQENLPLQYIVIQRFQELPFLLCSSLTRKVTEQDKLNIKINGNIPPNINRIPGAGQLMSELTCYSKQTGKMIPLPEKASQDLFSARFNSSLGYQELLIDSQSGKVELKSPSQSMSFMLVTNVLAASQSSKE